MPRMIAIVTGANSGVGFGISQRLLFQLSQSPSPDSLPAASIQPSNGLKERSESSPVEFESLTLILACRSRDRAHEARTRLLVLLDAELLRRKRNSNGLTNEYGERFRQSLQIDFVPCNLASAHGVFEFCNSVGKTYPYVSHIFCNAGTGSFRGIDWFGATRQLFTHPVDALTHPNFKLQSSGSLSDDGLGWVWQCNVFGHYLLVRSLRSSLENAPNTPARVLWTSSIEALTKNYDIDDWQLIKTPLSYEASKYQTELIGHRLNAAYSAPGQESGAATSPAIRHFIVHPGVVASSMFYEWLGPILNALMILGFYIARWLGSPNHPIDVLKGAISATHIALAPISSLPDATQPVRFGSLADRSGRERVGVSPIEGYDSEKEKLADTLIRKCDALCEVFEAREGRPVE